MSKRKQRMCKRCGQPFKSWHAHTDCEPPEDVKAEPEAQPDEKPPFKPRMVVGGAMMWVRQ